jgi:hypothetical protein
MARGEMEEKLEILKIICLFKAPPYAFYTFVPLENIVLY